LKIFPKLKKTPYSTSNWDQEKQFRVEKPETVPLTYDFPSLEVYFSPPDVYLPFTWKRDLKREGRG